MSNDRDLTVRDLMAESALGLKTVVSGDIEHVVRGAHTIEVAGAAEWLERDWVMLTTGIRFVGLEDAAAAQAKLVDELVEVGAAALLFGVDMAFSEVPQGIVQAAEKAGLSVLSVERAVPFLQVEQFVNRALMSADAFDVRRRLRVQEDLLDALASEQPVASLVHRLGALIKGIAIIYEESGRIVAATGEGPSSLIWSAIRSDSNKAPQRAFAVGRWFVVTRPVVLRGVGYWIALGSRRERVLDDMADALLDAAQRLLGALRGLRTLSVVQAVTEAQEILRITRSSMTPDSVHRVWERLRPFRFVPESSIRAFVTSVGGSRSGRPRGGVSALLRGHREIVDEMVELAQAHGLPLVVELRESRAMAGLVGVHPALPEWLNEVSADLRIGLSEPFSDLNLVGPRTRDAERALNVAERRELGSDEQERKTARSGVVLFEDVDMINWLLSSRSVQATSEKASRQLGELLENEELLETVLHYLSSGLDVKATAHALYLHPNTVRYRLRRASEFVGGSLNSVPVIANLYVALHDRIHGLPSDLSDGAT